LRKTIGVFAHVDAGKTTFSEQLLYHTGSIRNLGRVDRKDAFLDDQPLERERGITIFSNQAVFSWKEDTYYLVDTPGHMDFVSEAERAARVIDYAIVLVSCVEGIEGQTEAVWEFLEEYKVPTFFFLNKTDRAGADPNRVMAEIRTRFSENCMNFTDSVLKNQLTQAGMEELALLDETLMEQYLEGNQSQEFWKRESMRLIQKRLLFPCFLGSALQDKGITEFLDALSWLTWTEYHSNAPFSAVVSHVRHDPRGGRITFLKIKSGVIKAKDFVEFEGIDGIRKSEKINEIRMYSGAKYHNLESAAAGDLCAVTGLTDIRAGDGVGTETFHTSYHSRPMLTAGVIYDSSIPAPEMFRCFQILEEEDPLLQISQGENGDGTKNLRVHIMGEIQLEIIRELIAERFGHEVEFGPCEVVYQETIVNPVTGCGHFEPLRHYAEVHLRLEPASRGSGITFESKCPTDILPSQFQNLIRSHVLERVHKGILTGSELTDVRMVLLNGRAHEKHTEGGDFREATWRAVRQGLEQAESILLEPYDSFRISVEESDLGRILSDLPRLNATFEAPEITGGRAVICGRGPASEFLEYGKHFVSQTRGTGRLTVRFDGYESCHNAQEVIARIHYDKIRDIENPSSSVFCSHGTSIVVPWQEAKAHMHCK
jgi:ribosomal protection tetracycline resistance protein